MATRARIALQLTEDSFLSVYHHWDGYPQWLGVTLNKKFNTREKVAELIDGGDISCCDSDRDWNLEPVEKHVQYYNDRGENTEPALHLNIDDYFECGEEYAYVFTLDHEWECYAINHTYDDEYKITGTNVVSQEIPADFPKELTV
jgi:hypothetical protein